MSPACDVVITERTAGQERLRQDEVFKLNSHNLHKPEHSDSRGSSEATAAASSSLKRREMSEICN